MNAKVQATFQHFQPSQAQSVEIRIDFLTHSIATEFAASLPKTFRARVHKVVGGTAAVILVAGLTKNGTNGEKNETGIARYRKMIARLEKMGFPVEWTAAYSNSYKTRGAFEAAL